ncbi:hypothetical protein [Streptomyces acidicola]|uniref:hypothetical protein n=1 Tax=Streptomyces acidicola TaxID=2596892 RepID=UPI00342C533E
MTTKITQGSGDPGPEPRSRGRQLATTATQADPAPGWTPAQINGLIAALNKLPRRLARQELGEDERLYTPQFDAFYAAMRGAADAINKRTVRLRHPTTSAHWSLTSFAETTATVDTRLVAPKPTALSSVTKIDLFVGGRQLTWDPNKPNPEYPATLDDSYLRMEVPVAKDAGAGPFPITGDIIYKGPDGLEYKVSLWPSVAVPHRRLTVLP